VLWGLNKCSDSDKIIKGGNNVINNSAISHSLVFVTALVQDASRLVDLCRESIVYDSPHALAAGLRAIGADPEVVVMRVKNRLESRSGAAESTGYRDVVLSIRVVSSLAVRLGIGIHVCEVQLILQAIAELKVLVSKRGLGTK
jgi:hypothetical protein